MEAVIRAVDDVLRKLAVAKKMPADAPLQSIVFDSLDQMRLLVALEDRLGMTFDDAALQPFRLESREALVDSVTAMIGHAQ